jgi:transcriptional regulator with XRE-family HTH domain
VRRYREQSGLTQKQLSKALYCSDSLISAIENGTKTAQSDLVPQIDAELKAEGIISLV